MRGSSIDGSMRFRGRSPFAVLVLAAVAASASSGCGDAAPGERRHAPAARHGDVIWRGDAEQPLVQQWAEYSTGPHCAQTSDLVSRDSRVRRTRSSAQGRFAYRSVITDGTDCYGERSEIGQALPSRGSFTEARLFRDGDRRWISFQIRLGPRFPVGTRHWNVVAQWKQLAVAGVPRTPVLALEVRDRTYLLDNTGPAGGTSIPLAAATTRRWTRFTLHVRFSPDPAVGFAEIWSDSGGGRLRPVLRRTPMSTLGRSSDGAPVPSAARIGIYRNPRIDGSAQVLYDGYTVARTRKAAEANAFR